MLDLLAKCLSDFEGDYAEMRFHQRESTYIRMAAGELEDATFLKNAGVGVRALVNGSWGFSSTNVLKVDAIRSSLKDAEKAAGVASQNRTERIKGLAEAELAKGTFCPTVNDPAENHSMEEKMNLVIEAEKTAKDESKNVRSAISVYSELIDRKVVVNTDGAEFELHDVKPEFYVYAIASENGDRVGAMKAASVTGGWKDLWRRNEPEQLALDACNLASRLLHAKHPKGETATVVLEPSLVGLISHEAIGHTVEADFVLSGSITKGKLGHKLASELVTLVDSGNPEEDSHGTGSVLVDDEGVPAKRTKVIENGVLKSYLHDRESALMFDTEPTGNARAFEYTDEPIIRMTNTYILPGDYSMDEIIEGVKEGYLMRGAGNGQADSNAEFMFEVDEAYMIRKGEVKELLRGVTISGQAFDVLKSVDAVGKDFLLDIGVGFCGKYQRAKVDGGGGAIRCKAIIGGRQEG
ncbi:MAG: TldD/PmbA family protein [Thermoplasmata archaeon]